MRLRFTKMHGAGNDFVMLDGISQKISLSPERIKRLADRRFGVGCDQVLMVEAPRSPEADFRYRIFNQDGAEVENCGNGARCFAVFVRQRGLTHKQDIVAETAAGSLKLHVHPGDRVTVNMGIPILNPREIPFSAAQQALTYPLQVQDKVFQISAISMGNPHAVTVVEEVERFNVEEIGRIIESHEDFPNRVNAGFLEITSRTRAKLRVFERGVGETLACGTGACAAMVAGRLLNHFDSKVQIALPGGDLSLEWDGEGEPVMMTGPTKSVFQGQVKI